VGCNATPVYGDSACQQQVGYDLIDPIWDMLDFLEKPIELLYSSFGTSCKNRLLRRKLKPRVKLVVVTVVKVRE